MNQNKDTEGFTEVAVRVNKLAEIRRKAMRKRVWFKVLDHMERAIVSLVVRCVDTVRSTKLAKIVKAIVIKLGEAMKSEVERMMETVGRSIALRLSSIAQNWGNINAHRWADDEGFIKYLTIIEINNHPMFRRIN